VKSLRQPVRALSALALAMASLGASSVASAQMMGSSSSGPWVRPPGSSYAGFNIGRANYSIPTGAFASDTKDTTYGINLGSYFTNYAGVEIGYIDFGNATRGGGGTEAQGFNISLVGRFPFGERIGFLGSSFNLLGKIGTTYTRTETTSLVGSGIPRGKEDGFGLSLGVGAEYQFATNLSAVLQYDRHNVKFAGDQDEHIGVTSVGLRYRF
jgi:OmpA-OmpF porin, OOP family